jgi:hypothetical protein
MVGTYFDFVWGNNEGKTNRAGDWLWSWCISTTVQQQSLVKK